MNEGSSTAPSIVVRNSPVPRPVAAPSTRRSDALVPLRRFGLRLSSEWLPAVGWFVGRTGRTGLIGIGLLIASAVFVASTHLKVVDEVSGLRQEIASAHRQASAGPREATSDPLRALRSLPTRADMPAVLGVLLKQADAAHLTLDTGKYEISATKSGEFTRYKLSFPITGPYPQVRGFIDSTLQAMPAVAISNLSFERKTIGDPTVEAQIRMTVFTRSAP